MKASKVTKFVCVKGALNTGVQWGGVKTCKEVLLITFATVIVGVFLNIFPFRCFVALSLYKIRT
jgi:hypothetical protein